MVFPPPDCFVLHQCRCPATAMSDGAQATPAPGATMRQQVAARFMVCGVQPRFGRFSMSGIAPPRAPADVMPAFAHVLEKIDTRQDLKWCAAIFDCAAVWHDWPVGMRYNQDAKKCRSEGTSWVHRRWSLLLCKGMFGDGAFRNPGRANRHVLDFRYIHGIAGNGQRRCVHRVYRHEVPLALLAAIEAVQPGNFSLLPSLSALNGWRADRDDRPLSDDLLA
jgi:hypothetical protein